MARVPVFCDSCGLVFPSPFSIGPGQLTLIGNRCNCPRCGAMARVLDGVVSAVEQTLHVLSAPQHTLVDLKRLADLVAHARETKQSKEDVGQSITKEVPSLTPLIALLPANKTDLMAFLGVVLAAAQLVQSCASSGAPPTAITVNQVVEQIYISPQPKQPPPAQSSNKVGRNDQCPCGSGKKYKRCCGRPK